MMLANNKQMLVNLYMTKCKLIKFTIENKTKQTKLKFENSFCVRSDNQMNWSGQPSGHYISPSTDNEILRIKNSWEVKKFGFFRTQMNNPRSSISYTLLKQNNISS